MRRAAWFAVALFAAVAGNATAQDYPGARPAPRTTDPQRMAADARRREAAERVRFAYEAELRADWTRAETELRRAIDLQPPEPLGSTARYDLGLAQAHLGRLAESRAAFTEAVARDGDFIAARVNLVAVDLMMDDAAAARRDADALLARAPGSARALYERGVAALRAGDAQTALHDFGALLARDPSYATGRLQLALAEMKAGRFADAERDLEAALALAPGYARARFALGAVLLHVGRRDDARAAFERAAADARDPALHALALSFVAETR
jgi:tetratricopeptide (TPR) repeat protein